MCPLLMTRAIVPGILCVPSRHQPFIPVERQPLPWILKPYISSACLWTSVKWDHTFIIKQEFSYVIFSSFFSILLSPLLTGGFISWKNVISESRCSLKTLSLWWFFIHFCTFFFLQGIYIALKFKKSNHYSVFSKKKNRVKREYRKIFFENVYQFNLMVHIKK